jgi:hypothetical protein
VPWVGFGSVPDQGVIRIMRRSISRFVFLSVNSRSRDATKGLLVCHKRALMFQKNPAFFGSSRSSKEVLHKKVLSLKITLQVNYGLPYFKKFSRARKSFPLRCLYVSFCPASGISKCFNRSFRNTFRSTRCKEIK